MQPLFDSRSSGDGARQPYKRPGLPGSGHLPIHVVEVVSGHRQAGMQLLWERRVAMEVFLSEPHASHIQRHGCLTNSGAHAQLS